MRRAFSALREWGELRKRLREERQFHLYCAREEFRSLGMSPKSAKQEARLRFGGRQHTRVALRELGGDWVGLVELLRAHRIAASAWLQPATLLLAIVAVFAFSPSPGDVLERVIVHVHNVENPGAVLFSVPGRSAWRERGIAPSEFQALRTMSTVTYVERYRGLNAWARATRGASLAAIESEARGRTGNPHLVATSIARHMEISAGPAQCVWLFAAIYGMCVVAAYVRQFETPRWLLWRWLFYGLGLAALHAVASLAALALVFQLWNRRQFTGGETLTFAFLYAAYLGMVAIQCRCWWIDLRGRCPICLDGLILPSTEGATGGMLVNPTVTGSVCAHGHGILAETPWSRTFRVDESPLQGLVHV
jgi:hypothetical protein